MTRRFLGKASEKEKQKSEAHRRGRVDKSQAAKEDGRSDELPVVQNAHGIECDIEEASRTYVRQWWKRGKQTHILKGFECLPRKAWIPS